MKVIMGTWMDNMMGTFDIQLYDADIPTEDILASAIAESKVFGHTVISQTDNYIVFSDGSRLLLNLYNVIPSVNLPIYNERLFDE